MRGFAVGRYTHPFLVCQLYEFLHQRTIALHLDVPLSKFFVVLLPGETEPVNHCVCHSSPNIYRIRNTFNLAVAVLDSRGREEPLKLRRRAGHLREAATHTITVQEYPTMETLHP